MWDTCFLARPGPRGRMICARGLKCGHADMHEQCPVSFRGKRATAPQVDRSILVQGCSILVQSRAREGTRGAAGRSVGASAKSPDTSANGPDTSANGPDTSANG